MKIAVLGAGSIGCYVAGCLLASDPTLSTSNALTLIGRQRLYDDITSNGLKITDWQGREQLTKPDISLIENDSLVMLTSFCFALKAKIPSRLRDNQSAYRQSAVVVSLQNGVSNAHLLRQHIKQCVIAGMVPFNVFYKGNGHFHCGTEGNIALKTPITNVVTL